MGNRKQPASGAAIVDGEHPDSASRADRIAAGRLQRHSVPRSSLGQYQLAGNRPDPISLLRQTSHGRIKQLVSLRYGRMLPSPFTYLRGAAAAMAFDLSHGARTDLRVQLCGDCHLLNIGGYGTPERNFVFDIVDYDETLPGPFEWDVKRLAASFYVAGRTMGHSESACRDAATNVACAYRERTAEYAQMRALDVWYARIDELMLLDNAADSTERKHTEAGIAKARARGGDQLLPKITESGPNGKPRFKEMPPTLFHPDRTTGFGEGMPNFLVEYRDTLSDERRVLFDRFRVLDVCMKVVGIGSVGTRCAIVLLEADDGDYLVLQIKEAGESVLERYLGKSQFAHPGQRVVVGQRLMQTASDIFLGWATAKSGEHFYVRQLRDMKGSMDVEGVSDARLIHFGGLCGWALARAHAKAGDAARVRGYLGKGDTFDRAMAVFAKAYADQTEQDHAALVRAVRLGKLAAVAGV